MVAAPALNPTLIIVCGLPGSGKTTHAKALEQQRAAIRLSPDEWLSMLGCSLWDESRRAQVETLQWQMAQRLLVLGCSVILEWGTWSKAERDALRESARSLGARVELHLLDESVDVLFARVAARRRESPPIELVQLERWSAAFERPTPEEHALFDPAPDRCCRR